MCEVLDYKFEVRFKVRALRQSVARNLMTDEDYQKDAARKAKNAEKMRRWRESNPLSPEKKAEEAERARQWRMANPERYREQQNTWYANKRERVKATNRARAERRRKASGRDPAAVNSDE